MPFMPSTRRTIRKVSETFSKEFKAAMKRMADARELQARRFEPSTPSVTFPQSPPGLLNTASDARKRAVISSFDPALNDGNVKYIRTIALQDGRFAALITHQNGPADFRYYISIHDSSGNWVRSSLVKGVIDTDPCDHDIALHPNGNIIFTFASSAAEGNKETYIREYDVLPDASLAAIGSPTQVASEATSILYSRLKIVNGQIFCVYCNGPNYKYNALDLAFNPLGNGTLDSAAPDPHISMDDSPTALGVYYHKDAGSLRVGNVQFFDITNNAVAPQPLGSSFNATAETADNGWGGIIFFPDIGQFRVFFEDVEGRGISINLINFALTAVQDLAIFEISSEWNTPTVLRLPNEPGCALSYHSGSQLKAIKFNGPLVVTGGPYVESFASLGNQNASLSIAINGDGSLFGTLIEGDGSPLAGFFEANFSIHATPSPTGAPTTGPELTTAPSPPMTMTLTAAPTTGPISEIPSLPSPASSGVASSPSAGDGNDFILYVALAFAACVVIAFVATCATVLARRKGRRSSSTSGETSTDAAEMQPHHGTPATGGGTHARTSATLHAAGGGENDASVAGADPATGRGHYDQVPTGAGAGRTNHAGEYNTAAGSGGAHADPIVYSKLGPDGDKTDGVYHAVGPVVDPDADGAYQNVPGGGQ